MKKILIISPCFPPINTPDLHRVRLSIPWFQKNGWTVKVLAVQPRFIEAKTDPVLEQLTDPCEVIRVQAFHSRYTRKFGLGNLGYRAWLQLMKAGSNLLKKEKFDLIYFSTTVFPVMTLGRIWKNKYNIPFVLDMQDPWRNDFYLSQPKSNRPPKYKLAHLLDSVLEKWTVPHCNGIISVSDAYPKTLNSRYGTNIPSKVITFSASKEDFNIVEKLDLKNKFFQKDNDSINLLYTGAVTPGMPIPLKSLLEAVKAYLSKPDAKKIKLYFVGTSYSENSLDKKVQPLAAQLGLDNNVFEYPLRIGYFETIKLLMDADALVLPGSIEAGYTASKIYPYILSEKPLFALTHVQSSVTHILQKCNAGLITTFETGNDLKNLQNKVNNRFEEFIYSLPVKADINWDFFEKYSDKTMAKKQLDFFNELL